MRKAKRPKVDRAAPSGAQPAATSYDEVPYESFPFVQTHPDRLATLAHLFGLSPPALERCSVLELGCAAGGNLLPMAVALPRAKFVGVDLSGVQVGHGQKVVDALGLTNVRLLATDLRQIGEGFGRFDYVIAHGVYSWVPNTVQDAILEICRRNLAADGIAYVSYNTLPGWHMRGMIRDLMRFQAAGFDNPAKRVEQARAMLDFLAQSVPEDGDPYGVLLRNELQLLRPLPDYYILHDHLEETNEPVYFHQFAERAARHGLQYLAEANFGSMFASGFAPQVAATLRRVASHVIRQEQLMDFLRNRMFRQTLLVHAECKIERAIAPDRLQGLWVASPLRPQSAQPNLGPEVPEGFATSGGRTLTTGQPLTKAALWNLSQVWPQYLAFSDLLDTAQARIVGQSQGASAPDPVQTLGTDLLLGFTVGAVELHAAAAPFTSKVSGKPTASPLARYQAGQGPRVTNLRHEHIQLGESQLALLRLLDGTRDRAALRAGVATAMQGSPSADTLEKLLRELAQAALLVA